MSLRTLIRFAGLALGLILSAPLLWRTAGFLPVLLAGCLLLLASFFLLLTAGVGRTSRWQIRYWLETQQANERLDATLGFLADRAGHVVMEANSQGLFLEAPAAFDRYVQVQLERALPEARVSRVSNNNNSSSRQQGASLHLCLDPLAYDLLRWATEGPSHQRYCWKIRYGICCCFFSWRQDLNINNNRSAVSVSSVRLFGHPCGMPRNG